MTKPVWHRIHVLCGTGGVGKTTVSASMAVAAALAGKRSLVITIDPAKRLATSLGIQALGDEASDLTPLLKKSLADARARGETVPGDESIGTLHALMPDARSNLRALFETSSPNPEVAKRIIENPIFKILASEFSGANEYMAMQKLHAVSTSGKYDSIFLDTPPSRSTLAFLGAPKLLARIFDEPWLKTILGSSHTILSAGIGKALGLLEKVTGKGFVGQLLEFTSALFELQGEFLKKLEAVHQLLHSEDALFTLVTTPHLEALPEARHLSVTLRERRYRFAGVVLNRTLSSFPITEEDLEKARKEEESGFPGRALGLKWMKRLLAREERVEALLMDSLSHHDGEKPSFRRLPELPRDAHTLDDLLRLARLL